MSHAIAQLNGEARKNWFNSAREIINGAKPSQKAEILQAAYNANCCTPEEIGQLMAGASQSLSFAKRRLSDGPGLTECFKGRQKFAEFTVSLPPDVQLQYHRHLKRLTEGLSWTFKM